MKMLFPRYAIGLLVGVILGLVFPSCASWWLLAGLLGVLVVNELRGQWGFGSHWNCYRLSSYALYTGPVVCALIGILLGSGKIGVLLINIGTLIS